MTTLTKQQFTQSLNGKTLSIADAKEDARLSGVNLKSSDLNNDGQISGETETGRLFDEIDKFDKNGDSNSVALTQRGRATAVTPKIAAIGEKAQVDTLRALANTGPRSNNDVVLLGMNKGSSHEAKSLRNRGLHVQHIKDARVDDTARGDDGKTYNLTTPDGVSGFVGSLKLPEAQSAKIEEVLNRADPDAKDELAQLTKTWAKGERGEEIPSRLVLSGHSVGDGVWGDHNGEIYRRDIADLAKAMPRAAAQVEDLHISGCYSGGQGDVDSWKGIFPKAKTVWAYTGSAPGSYSGATTHLARWDRATRGEASTLDRNVAQGTRKGDNVATWSVDEGYNNGEPPRSYSDVREDFDWSRPDYNQFFSGAENVENTQSGPLRDHYNNTQRLIQHRDLPENERAQLSAHRDSTIRLIYYSKSVAPNFQAHHQQSIREGFRSVGMTAPDFSKLSRMDALAQISAFENKVTGMGTPPAAAQTLLPLLTDGLRDLNSSIIPSTWI